MRTMPWSGIESEELDSENWIQVAFRAGGGSHREYRVFGELCGIPFSEHYGSDNDDNKSLAYSYYWEQLDKIESS
jgi:hypothetical protein